MLDPEFVLDPELVQLMKSPYRQRFKEAVTEEMAKSLSGGNLKGQTWRRMLANHVSK